MTAVISVMEQSKRSSALAQIVRSERAHRIFLDGTAYDLPLAPVALDLPVYRMANYRTSVEQLRYLADNPGNPGFFGQENGSAQRVQHQFLVELAKANRGNIYRELEDAQQREPLIVTPAAVVVNGNRRLAAMRELYATDPKRHERFGSVEVAILPDWNEDQIIALETDLQMAEELKLEYGWVHMALALRNQLEERVWSLEKASQHWKRDKKDLIGLRSQLELAEQFLVYIGKPGHYERISGDQQAFQTLQANLARSKDADPSVLEARKLTVFAVISNYDAAEVEGRVYDYASKAGPIVDRVVADPNVASAGAPSTPTAQPPGGTDNPLGGLPSAAAGVVSPGVLDVLRDAKNGPLIARAADQARADLAAEERQSKLGNQLARSVGEINAKAATLSLVNADRKSITSAASQLAVAVATLVELLTKAYSAYPEETAAMGADRLSATTESLKKLIANIESP